MVEDFRHAVHDLACEHVARMWQRTMTIARTEQLGPLRILEAVERYPYRWIRPAALIGHDTYCSGGGEATSISACCPCGRRGEGLYRKPSPKASKSPINLTWLIRGFAYTSNSCIPDSLLLTFAPRRVEGRQVDWEQASDGVSLEAQAARPGMSGTALRAIIA